MKTVNLNLYSFEELSEKAKERAISEGRDFLYWVSECCDDYKDDRDVIDFLLTNDYVYFENGKLVPATTFVGKHPRAGETEVNIHGQKIVLKD